MKITVKGATDYLVEEIMQYHNVSRAEAQNLLAKALVSASIENAIDAKVSSMLENK